MAVAAPKTTTGEMWWMNDPNLAKRYRKFEVRSSKAPKLRNEAGAFHTNGIRMPPREKAESAP